MITLFFLYLIGNADVAKFMGSFRNLPPKVEEIDAGSHQNPRTIAADLGLDKKQTLSHSEDDCSTLPCLEPPISFAGDLEEQKQLLMQPWKQAGPFKIPPMGEDEL